MSFLELTMSMYMCLLGTNTTLQVCKTNKNVLRMSSYAF